MNVDHWIAKEPGKRRQQERKATKAAALTAIITLALIAAITLTPH